MAPIYSVGRKFFIPLAGAVFLVRLSVPLRISYWRSWKLDMASHGNPFTANVPHGFLIWETLW
jgi:hypothetical protein